MVNLCGRPAKIKTKNCQRPQISSKFKPGRHKVYGCFLLTLSVGYESKVTTKEETYVQMGIFEETVGAPIWPWIPLAKGPVQALQLVSLAASLLHWKLHSAALQSVHSAPIPPVLT